MAFRTHRCTMESTTNTTASSISLMEAGTTIIFTPTAPNTIHIVDGLHPSHIPILYNGIRIIRSLRKTEHKLLHTSPIVRIAAIFTSQSHRITNMMEPSIIGSKRKKNTLNWITDIRKVSL